MNLGNLMVKKKYIKKVNQHIVSVGFPKTALEKWANGRKTDISEERVVIFLDERERRHVLEDFRIWKEHIKSKNESEKDGEYDILGDVYTKILLRNNCCWTYIKLIKMQEGISERNPMS